MAVVSATFAVDLPRSTEDVWEWTTDLRNVNALLHPFGEIRYDLSMPPWLYGGLVLPTEARILGVHAAWVELRIVAWQPGVMFVDEGVRDGRLLWRHEHIYQPTSNGTRYIDRITTDVGSSTFVSAQATRLLFKHRHRRLRQLLT